ncbi:MAG: hypothetical protein IT260_11445 [Saprospiraceae bacterium]|nr:hypothetical protein [Saprospiraceae bacterium]
MAKKILFIGGTHNQTTMGYRVAAELTDLECWYTPFYADGLLRIAAERGWADFSILGGVPRAMTEAFYTEKKVPVDYRAERNRYDLVVMCADLVVPRNIRNIPMILVQEGMMTPENWVYQLVKHLHLPRFLGNTSMTGLSHAYEKFCVASDGFRDMFIRKGVDPEKLVVTGVPNFDDVDKYRANDFPYHGYILGATSYLRESFQYENRAAFIRKVLTVADGRLVIFKLHPNENHARAVREIKRHAPQAIIYTTGDINPMIANCAAMVTKYSSVLMVALALGKPVYSDLEPAVASQLRPVQNGGTSAQRIADICRSYL